MIFAIANKMCLQVVQFWLALIFTVSVGSVLSGQQNEEPPQEQKRLSQKQSETKLLDEALVPVRLPNSQNRPNSQNQNEGPSPAKNVNLENSGDLIPISLYIRVFFILVFLLVVIYFTLKFLRKLSLQKAQLPGLGSGIQILSSQVLHGDRMIHVVEVGGECYLLGSSSGGVQLLDHYIEKEMKDRVLLEVTQKPGNVSTGNTALSLGSDFLQLIRTRLSRPVKPKTTPQQEENPAPPLAHIQEYRKRLRSAAQTLKETEPS